MAKPEPRRGRGIGCLLLVAAVSWGLPRALWASDSVSITWSKASPRISQLRWKQTQDIEVQTDKDHHAFVELKGEFTRSDGWTLLWPSLGKKIVTGKGQAGSFTIRVPIESAAQALDLTAVGPRGEVERESLVLSFPEWESFRRQRGVMTRERRFSVTPGLGVSFVAYSQPGMESLSQWGLSGKVSSAYRLNPRWELGASLYATLLPLATNQSGVAFRFLGANLRVGYVLPFIKSPWRLSVMAGAYYTTTLTSGSRFGYKDLTGPQIFPVLSRSFESGRSAFGYLKFSPILSGFAFLHPSNSELALGGGYGFAPLKNGHTFSVTLDAAILRLLLASGEVSSRSVTVGASYGF